MDAFKAELLPNHQGHCPQAVTAGGQGKPEPQRVWEVEGRGQEGAGCCFPEQVSLLMGLKCIKVDFG